MAEEEITEVRQARAIRDNKPAFEIIPIVRTPNVDPGQPIDIGLYLSGYGEVDRAKISLFHSQPRILDEEQPGEVDQNVLGKVDEENNHIISLYAGDPLIEKGSDLSKQLSRSGVTIGLGPINFVDDPEWRIPSGSHFEENDTYPRIVSEATWSGKAPIEITYNTSEDATPGDYQVHAVLTYGHDRQTFQSKKPVPVHINNRRERWEPIPTYAIIFAAVIGLASLIYETRVVEYILSSWIEIFSSVF